MKLSTEALYVPMIPPPSRPVFYQKLGV